MLDISSNGESESENDSDSGSEERSEEQNAKIILTSLQVDADSAETIDVVGVSACKDDDKDDDRDEDLSKSSLQGSNASTASYPAIQDPWEDSKDDFVSSQCATEIATDIRTAIKEKNNSRLARAINLYFTQCVAEKEVTREAVYALLDANEVAEWGLLLNPQQSVPESIPSPSVESIPKSTPKPVKTKSLSVGDRVIVSNPKLENYKGVKGRITAEWFTTKGKEYTVRFDEPIGTEDWADFTDSELSVDVSH